MKIAELPTPALLVDVDRVDRNVARMAAKAEQAGVAVRPHFKTSKLLEIVDMQVAAGAVGITCATDRELQALQGHGVRSILWGHQAVGPGKLDLAVQANRRGEVILAVDSYAVAAALNERAEREQVVVPCTIEVDTGMERCGVKPDEARELALAIRGLPALSLVGLMTHEGHLHRYLDDPVGLCNAARAAAQSLVGARRDCAAAGIELQDVSVGSTPGATLAPFEPGVTEVRPGTYVFFDANQVELGSADWSDCAVTVLARVVSRNRPGMAVVDAGLKELSGDGSIRARGYGRVVELDARLIHAYEEHGVLGEGRVAELEVGDLVQIIPNHACGAVNMWSRVTAVRDGSVVDEWHTRGRR